MSGFALPRSSFTLAVVLAFAALALGRSPPAVAATTLTWPNLATSGPCLGTLQACIDGAAAGDTVQIGVDDFGLPDRYTAINENIAISKSLTLRAAAGIDAVFLAGRNITVTPPFVPLVSYTIAIEGITLDRGKIAISDDTFNSSFRVENVRFNDVPDDQVAIDMLSQFGSSPNFQVLRNVIRFSPHGALSTRAIRINPQALNASITVAGNRIEAPRGGMQQAIVITSDASGPITVSNNTIEGRYFLSGIAVGQPISSGSANVYVANNSISGQHTDFGSGAAGLTIQLSNADAQVINNTIVYGSRGLIFSALTAAPSVTGVAANNLVAYNTAEGVRVDAAYTGISNRNNLVFNNGSNVGFVAGPGTLTSNPLLTTRGYPRPTDLSPAINSGSNSALTAIGLDPYDADGHPRVMLATVDIGAHEVGYGITDVHVTNAANLDTAPTNSTYLSSLAGAALVPSSGLVVNALHTPGAALELGQNLGMWLPAGAGNLPLAIYHESGANMTSGRRFAVTVPGFGLLGYTHVSAVSNVVAEYTRLSNAALDSHPEAIAVVTHNYLELGPYHDHAIGLEYSGSNWYVRNEDFMVDMLAGLSFNVVIAPALSENAFRVFAPTTTSEIALTHPLLDDNACAAPIVGRVNRPALPQVFNTTAFSLDYRAGTGGAPGRWFILAEGGGAPAFFPAGAAFNVIIDGAQANRCRADDAIFYDNFEP